MAYNARFSCVNDFLTSAKILKTLNGNLISTSTYICIIFSLKVYLDLLTSIFG